VTWNEAWVISGAWQAFLASALAGLASGLGGLVVVALPHLPRRIYDALLGFSAGVMLGAAALTLFWPALQQGSTTAAVLGAVAGGGMILVLDRFVPHLEPHFLPRLPQGGNGRLSTLLLAAMALHNLPEGLAVGVAYGSGKASFGLVVAIAVAAQNVPEGMAVALPLRARGASRAAAVLWATGSGLLEPLAAALGYHFVSRVQTLVPFGLALAAGAMVFVVSDQLIPECRRVAADKAPSVALLGGFVMVGVLLRWL
jgi:ZIP family zinc transporter